MLVFWERSWFSKDPLKNLEDPTKVNLLFHGYRSPIFLFRMVKTAPLYLSPFRSYKVNTDGAYYFEMDSNHI